MFEYHNEENEYTTSEINIEDIFNARLGEGDPLSWYNGSDREADTIIKRLGINHPTLSEIRRSREFKVALENYLTNNGIEINEKTLKTGGVLGEKRTLTKRHPDAEKFTIWGKLLEETDDYIKIQKLKPIANPFTGVARADLIRQILELQEKYGVSETEEDDNQDAETVTESSPE